LYSLIVSVLIVVLRNSTFVLQ